MCIFMFVLTCVSTRVYAACMCVYMVVCLFHVTVNTVEQRCNASTCVAQIAANIALVKNWTIHGIFWGAHQQAQPRVFRRTLEESVQWLAEGKVRVPVSHK